MKYFILFLFFNYMTEAQILNQRVVLEVSSTENEAKKVFDEINKYISTQKELQSYLLKHKIHPKSEKVEPYIFYTLGPIHKTKDKDTLYYLLYKKFPNMFSVNNTFHYVNKKLEKKETIPLPEIEKQNPVEKIIIDTPSKDESSFMDRLKRIWKNMDSEWLGLLVLAFVGFILILRSAKQISKIKHLQREVEEYQHNMSEKVHAMGEKS